MDTVEFPAAVGTNLMRSSGCGGGGAVTRVELVTSQLESATCSSFFHPPRGTTYNINGARPAFWNNISAMDLVDHDMTSLSQANKSQQKSTKTSTSNGNYSRRSRIAHMEAAFSATGSLDLNEKTQTANQKTVSVKRSEKRNSKISKSKCDSFSLKAGLSSFSSAAGANNIFGVYGLKQDNCDIAKHVDDFSLNELLDGGYKCCQFIKNKGNNLANSNESILRSVKDACSVLQLKKSTQPQNLPVVDTTFQQNASSCLPNSGATKSDDSNRDKIDPSFINKVEDSCPKVLEFPLTLPKHVIALLALSSPKDLDVLLFDSLKPSPSKGNRGGLLSFPWSHISGGHYKTNPDVVKLTPNKTICQGKWVKIGNPTTSCGTANTFLNDLGSFVYDHTLVPSVIASNTPDGGVLAAAHTLCEFASRFQKRH